MNTDDIQQKLADLDADLLKDFILNLYMNHPDLHEPIETLLLHNDPKALAQSIKKRIQAISRGRRFIDYRDSIEFSHKLDQIVIDIESGFIDCPDGKVGFDLIDKFLSTGEKVMDRVDDSAGVISDVYRSAVLMWLTLAKRWNNAKENWLERVFQMHMSNDYGLFDPLLPNANLLLNDEQLKQLAWRFEANLRSAMKDKSDDSFYAKLRSQVGLNGVAEALNDPELYERAMLIGSPEPNEKQKKRIVEMYLKFDKVDRALEWLNTEWSHAHYSKQLQLFDKAYAKIDDKNEQKEIRNKIYQHEKSYSSLKEYLKLLSEGEEKQSVINEAITQAESSGDITTRLTMLLSLEQIEKAENLAAKSLVQLEQAFYSTVADLAKAFDKHNACLGATACYRALILDILREARSKAYTYAARYFKKLEVMESKISDFSSMSTHSEFVKQLKEMHGKKHSFWSKVEL